MARESTPAWRRARARRWSQFVRTYADLAEEGRCDEPFGTEFQRVWMELDASGAGDIRAFIIAAANRPPRRPADPAVRRP